MSRGTSIPITPEVLDWAIQNSGFSLTEIAEELGVGRGVIESWVHGEGEPLLTQFRDLADLLKRPTAFFLLPEPPAGGLPQAKFRHPPEVKRTRPTAAELRYLRETARLQRTLAWIRREMGSPVVALDPVSTTVDVDEIGLRVRRVLNISSAQQQGWPDSSSALRAWRDALGQIGIFVFLFPLGPNSCRGFSLWDPYAPVIAVNTHWKTEARMFTMFHELGHLLNRSSSMCMSPASHLRISGGDVVERWCERFAASVLMPWKPLTELLREQIGWNGSALITDLDDVRVIARKFKVSLRAAALRLIEGGYAEWPLYDEIPSWSDDKSGGGGGGRTRKKMREDWYGNTTVRTFVEALDNDLISRADVLTYLNVSDTDLYGIQEQAQT